MSKFIVVTETDTDWKLFLDQEENLHTFKNDKTEIKFSIIEKKNGLEIITIKGENNKNLEEHKILGTIFTTNEVQELLHNKNVKTDRPN